jgi:nucleoid DNA-binding protein
MNHTERIHQAARQVRGLTRAMAREAIEGYLRSAADDLAEGNWVTLPGIGRIQLVIRRSGGRLRTTLKPGEHGVRQPLRTRRRVKAAYPGSARPQPGSARNQSGEGIHSPGSVRSQTEKE